MIGYLAGEHLKTLPYGLILAVNGVGYSIETPLSTLSSLKPEGERIELWIHTLVREDAIRLFGFQTYEEKYVFNLLLTLNGVGPKVGLAMLSTLGVEGVRESAMRESTHLLLQVPGIGPRLAEKIIVELKPKLPKLTEVEFLGSGLSLAQMKRSGGSSENPAALSLLDLKSALENLGFKAKVVDPLLADLSDDARRGLDFQALLKLALGQLTAKPDLVRSNSTQSIDEVL